MDYRIPFNKPFIVGKELLYIDQSVHDGHTSGDGPFTRKCQELLNRRFGIKRALLTTSGTAALELAALLACVTKGDEVILPSYTFVSTANAFALRGATLKFVDIRSDTMNMDETLLESAITERTRVIVPVHYAGVGCEMNPIMELANKHNLLVVEDAAQGVNAQYHGRYLGTIGDIGAFSFHETKNITCGEGGALLVNRQAYEDRAEVLREKGTNRMQFFRGQIDKYTWVDTGSSYAMSDILAAFLYAQLESIDIISDKRRNIYNLYYSALSPLAEEGLIRLPHVPDHCIHSYHMFYILLKSIRERSSLIAHLKSKGILAVFHYVPLHTSLKGTDMGYSEGMLPVTEKISETLLRLPFYYELTEHDIKLVTDEIYSFFGKTAP